MPGLERLHRRIDEPGVDDLDSGPAQPFGHHVQVAEQPRVQPVELRPVGVEADAEETDAHVSHDVPGIM